MHIAASVGYFIEYIMMHGTINIKYTAVIIHIITKSKAEIWPLHKVYVNVTPGKYLYIVKMWSVN